MVKLKYLKNSKNDRLRASERIIAALHLPGEVWRYFSIKKPPTYATVMDAIIKRMYNGSPQP